MRLAVVVAFTSLLLVAETRAAPSGYTGNDLLEQCQKVLAATDTGKAVPGTELSMGRCIGFIRGVFNTMVLSSSLEPPIEQKYQACFPNEFPDIENRQLVRIVVKYLSDHPETLHNDQTMLTMAAISKSWACK
jgi:hypothetical protein